MTPEEQRALVQFFGTVHAQAKQTDQMIVGNSQFVKPVSPSIQQGLEQALRIPVQANHEFPQQQHIEPPSQPLIETPQFIHEPVVIEQSVNTSFNLPVNNTVEESKPVVLNNDIVEVLRDINLNLARIGSILEKQNGKPKRTKASKSD